MSEAYRIYSIKCRGAYLIFAPQVRRLFEGGAYSSKYGNAGPENCRK